MRQIGHCERDAVVCAGKIAIVNEEFRMIAYVYAVYVVRRMGKLCGR